MNTFTVLGIYNQKLALLEFCITHLSPRQDQLRALEITLETKTPAKTDKSYNIFEKLYARNKEQIETILQTKQPELDAIYAEQIASLKEKNITRLFNSICKETNLLNEIDLLSNNAINQIRSLFAKLQERYTGIKIPDAPVEFRPIQRITTETRKIIQKFNLINYLRTTPIENMQTIDNFAITEDGRQLQITQNPSIETISTILCNIALYFNAFQRRHPEKEQKILYQLIGKKVNRLTIDNVTREEDSKATLTYKIRFRETQQNITFAPLGTGNPAEAATRIQLTIGRFTRAYTEWKKAI